MNYYRKTVNNTANDVKLKMQIGAITVNDNFTGKSGTSATFYR